MSPSQKDIILAGVKLQNTTQEALLGFVQRAIQEGAQRYIVTPNPEFVVQAQKDKNFKDLLNRADMSLPDGVGVVIASVLKYGHKINRLPGTDMTEWLIGRLASSGVRVALVGGLDDAAEKAAKILRQRYGNENIFGFKDGATLEEINKVRPRLVFVGMGSPKQEFWMVQNMKNLPSGKIFMGVGGAFDFISGKVRRAPRWVRKAGLEWFFRLILQPWRWKRALKATFVFLYYIIKDIRRSKINIKNVM